jgi:hypothetical protein
MIKRRDNALRQIARWRDGLGAKARRLSDKFVAEQALAESYCATQFLAYAEIDDPAGGARAAAPPLASAGDFADAAPPVPLADEAAGAAPSRASAGEAVEAAPPLPTSDEAAAPPLAPAGEDPESCTRPCLSGAAISAEKQVATQLLADAETEDTAGGAMRAASPLASARGAVDAAQGAPPDEAAEAAPRAPPRAR